MANETARAVVEGDTKKAVAAMKRLAGEVKNTTGAMDKAGSSSQKMGGGLGGMTALASKAKFALGAAGLALGLKEAISAGDKMLEKSFKLQSVFNNLSIDITKAQRTTMGLVDSFTLAQSANSAVRLGVAKTGEDFANLAGAATKLGLSVGLDATTATENLITALGRQSPMILDNLGITLKVGDAHRVYAERLGKTTKELTDAEKAEAFRVVAMEKALQKSKEVNIEVGGLAGLYQRLKVAATDAIDAMLGGDTGKGETLDAVRNNYKLLGEEVVAQIDQMGRYGEAVRIVEGRMRRLGVQNEDMAATMVQLKKHHRDQIELMKEEAEQAAILAREKERLADIDRRKMEIQDLEHIEALTASVGATKRRALADEEAAIHELFEARGELVAREFEGEEKAQKLRELYMQRTLAMTEAITRHEEQAAERSKEAMEKRKKAQEEALKLAEKAAKEAEKAEEERIRALEESTKAFEDHIKQKARLAREQESFDQQMLEAQHHRDFQRIDALDREAQRMQSLGQDAEFVFRRRAELAEELNKTLGKAEVAEEIRFKEQLRRNKVFLKEHEKKKKNIAEETKLFTTAMFDASHAAAQASKDKRKAFLEELEAFAFSRGRMLLIEAAYHAAKAIVSAVSFNYVQAAAEATAAGIAAAKAAAFMTGAVVARAGGGGFGGSGGGSSADGGSVGSAPVAPQSRGGGGSVDVDQPLSPLDEEVDRRVGAGTSSRAAANGATINHFSGTFIGSSKADVGRWINEAQEESRRVDGNLGI